MLNTLLPPLWRHAPLTYLFNLIMTLSSQLKQYFDSNALSTSIDLLHCQRTLDQIINEFVDEDPEKEFIQDAIALVSNYDSILYVGHQLDKLTEYIIESKFDF